MPLAKIVEIFKKHVNLYISHEFKFVFKPEWRSGTLIALAKNYLNNNVNNTDYIDKMNDALQDEGLNDQEMVSFLHEHNRIIAIWVALNAM